MRVLLLLLAGICAVNCKDKLKFVRFKESGVVTTKGTRGNDEFVSFKAMDGTEYTCLLEFPDQRFTLFQAGDFVSVDGKKAEAATYIGWCSVLLWQSS